MNNICSGVRIAEDCIPALLGARQHTGGRKCNVFNRPCIPGIQDMQIYKIQKIAENQNSGA